MAGPTLDSGLGTRDSIASRLRAETRDEHERVEAIVDLMRPDLTLERYTAWVAAFWGYIDAWEPAVREALAGVVPDLGARRKRPLLRRDLDALLPTSQSGIPRCRSLPRVDTVPRALGSLYVLEGSTLGGRQISRHVGRVLSLDGASGCAYFRGYGDMTGLMWRRFGEVLARHAEAGGPAVDDEVVAGARETFETLAAWLASAVQGVGWRAPTFNPDRST